MEAEDMSYQSTTDGSNSVSSAGISSYETLEETQETSTPNEGGTSNSRKRKLTSSFVGNFDQEHCRDKLARMVILHDFPLSVVDYVGFRDFVFSLQPSFKMISRNTLKSDIYKVHDVEKEKVLKLLALCKGRVSITTDMWTSKNKKRVFMAIMAHFVDEAWKLQSVILRFIYVPSPHTPAVLQEVVLDAMLEWNIDRRLGCLTVDNSNTNDCMVRLLLEKLQLSTLLVRGEFFHIQCAAHIINSIVQDGLKVVEGCIEKVRDSVSFWIASPKRKQQFRETAKQIPLECTKELILDCKTRWNSTYFMLSTALEYKDVFFQLRQHEKDYTTLPSEEEWDRVEKICEKLSLFYDLTCVFSGTNYPTANVYFTNICCMKIEIRKWLVSDEPFIGDMTKLMLEKFENYWSHTNGIMGVASVLDPRYKMMFLNFMFPKIYGETHAESQIKRVENLCLDLMRQYSAKRVASTLASSTSRVGSSSGKRVGTLDDEYDLFVSKRSRNLVDVEVELRHYLEDGVLPRNTELDVLFWWKSNGVKYPTLRLIARDILAIPVSTIASESAFSTSDRKLSPHRCRLNPKTMEVLMCAQSWLWSEIKGKTTSPGDDIQSILDDSQESDECESGVSYS